MNNTIATDERRILLGITTDLAAILDAGKPSGYGFAFEKMRYEDATNGLVRPNGAKWLGGALDHADRMRWLRTLARMERRGLIERVRMGYAGRHTTHVALLPAGRQLAEQLRKEAEVDG